MSKLIGYVPMKKREGKVCFLVSKASGSGVGEKADTVFLYDDMANRINENSVGKNVTFDYGRGYNGNAYVADVHIN